MTDSPPPSLMLELSLSLPLPLAVSDPEMILDAPDSDIDADELGSGVTEDKDEGESEVADEGMEDEALLGSAEVLEVGGKDDADADAEAGGMEEAEVDDDGSEEMDEEDIGSAGVDEAGSENTGVDADDTPAEDETGPPSTGSVVVDAPAPSSVLDSAGSIVLVGTGLDSPSAAEVGVVTGAGGSEVIGDSLEVEGGVGAAVMGVVDATMLGDVDGSGTLCVVDAGVLGVEGPGSSGILDASGGSGTVEGEATSSVLAGIPATLDILVRGISTMVEVCKKEEEGVSLVSESKLVVNKEEAKVVTAEMEVEAERSSEVETGETLEGVESAGNKDIANKKQAKATCTRQLNAGSDKVGMGASEIGGTWIIEPKQEKSKTRG
ncbi:hypothetical protein BDQ17DRAFT_233355 [Cyathus striatus]|nr:hypothetical protein BDQ17DRAFT_233355 [Cyathus striatus]